IGRGDKVAVLMSNSIAALTTILGVVKAGACVVPLSGLLTGPQLAVLIDDADAVMLIASSEYLAVIGPLRDSLGKLRTDGLLLHGGEGDGWRRFESLLEGAADSMPPVRYHMDDEFNIIYSSGTTGLPKGIVQTHRPRQHWSYSNSIELAFGTDSRALATTPVYSNGTFLMILPALFTGSTLVVMPSFSPRGFLETVARERITHTFMVPPQFIAVLADPELASFDLSSLAVMLSGGSPLRRDTKRNVIERLGPGLYEMYGFSEGCATMIRPHQHGDKFGSVGTPVLGFEVRVVDEHGNELPRGEIGEIAGFGGGQMKAYHKRPEETERIICRDERGRAFLRSGDIGRMDQDGFLYILDRKKDMIISGGFNVFPADIESVIGEHDDVRDVAVIGIPDDRWGETPLALVIAKDGVAADGEAIRDWTNERVAKHQRLAGVEFRAEFPRNALGKILKRHLREPYWEDGAK
ncbi:MAG: AMP-binding protein, partial [Alphaproteobacteria bacterium]|nr:AMP-binding protein [Alphaproteobacteria bacterium]